MLLAFSLPCTCNAIPPSELHGSLLKVFNLYFSVSLPSLAILPKSIPNCLSVPYPCFSLSSFYYMTSLYVLHIYVYMVYVHIYRVYVYIYVFIYSLYIYTQITFFPSQVECTPSWRVGIFVQLFISVARPVSSTETEAYEWRNKFKYSKQFSNRL